MGENSQIVLEAAGSNEINVTGDNTTATGDGINIGADNRGSLSLIANQDNRINAKSSRGDGIMVDGAENGGNITLSAVNGNNEISAGNNGIDHHGTQSIILEAGKANIITAGVHADNQGREGDGIRIEGTGNVTASAEYNWILAQDDGLYINTGTSGNITVNASVVDADGNGNVILGESYGVHNSGKKDENSEDATASISVIAENGNNFITGGASAVYNHGSGDILIQAGSINGNGVSTLKDYNDRNNILIGRGDGEPGQVSGNGIASDSTGKTKVIAEGYNNIYGSENGIYSTNGTIDVKAGTNNIIGQYEDEEGIVHTSKNGINVESGIVNLTAGNVNRIYALKDGINVAGEQSSFNLIGDINLLNVSSNDNLMVNGVLIHDNSVGVFNGRLNYINVYSDQNSDSTTAINVGKKIKPIDEKGGSCLYLSSKGDIINEQFIISASSDSNRGTVKGVYVSHDSSVLTEQAIGDVSIDVNSSADTAGSSAYGIYVSGDDSYFDVNVNSLLVSVSAKDSNLTSGIAKSALTVSKGTIKVNAKQGIEINAKTQNDNLKSFSSSASTISATGGQVLLNSESSDIVINRLSINGDENVKDFIDEINRSYKGIHVSEQGLVSLSSGTNNIINSSIGVFATGANPVPDGEETDYSSGAVSINAAQSNIINSTNFGIQVNGLSNGEKATRVALNADINNINIYSDIGTSSFGTAIQSSYDGKVTIGNFDKNASETNIYVSNRNEQSFCLRGFDVEYGGSVTVNSNLINLIVKDTIQRNNQNKNYGVYAYANGYSELNSQNINISVENGYGLFSTWGSHIILNSENSYISTKSADAIYADKAWQGSKAIVDLKSISDNYVYADLSTIDNSYYGSGYAVRALDESSVTLEAGNDNQLLGAVYANGSGTNVFIGGSESEGTAARENRIYSYAYISGAGDLGDDPEGAFGGKNVISALYAEGGANIELSG
ncbi:beta strand repeat-containing protein, partial [Succinatimonas hippei]|uniref:beta strand repeat-containing protein n=1 Tax=Succinatimonas hippei TaxID=626938 RepID=UPI0023F871BB